MPNVDGSAAAAPTLVKALYPFAATTDSHLSMVQGEIYTLLDGDYGTSNWWRVKSKSGGEGVVPSNYVEKMPPVATCAAPVAQAEAVEPLNTSLVAHAEAFAADAAAAESILPATTKKGEKKKKGGTIVNSTFEKAAPPYLEVAAAVVEETSFDAELRGRSWSTTIPKRASFHQMDDIMAREKDLDEIKSQTVANTLHGIRPAEVNWKKSKEALANPFVAPKTHELLQNPMSAHPDTIQGGVGPDLEYMAKRTKVSGHTWSSKPSAQDNAMLADTELTDDLSVLALNTVLPIVTETMPKPPAKATAIAKENAKTRVSTVVHDVASWHASSTLVDPTIVDDVSPMLLPGEEVIASLPMVAVLGLPKFRDNRVGHGHVILTKTTRQVFIGTAPTGEFHRRLIFMIAGKHQAFGGVEKATNDTYEAASSITCMPESVCQFECCYGKKSLAKDAFHASSAAAGAQIKASAAFSTIPVDDHVRGARAEAAEVTSIVRNWFMSYGVQKKKAPPGCTCCDGCPPEELFCGQCCGKICPTSCCRNEHRNQGEESALEAQLKGIMSDTMNDALFVEDHAASTKKELSRDQKTEVTLEESETQEGGRLHTLIVSYQDPVTSESSETVVLVDPKKADLMKMFQFASQTEPKNGQAGSHLNQHYSMLRGVAKLDSTIDVQPKKAIKDVGIRKKNTGPHNKKILPSKSCCWCGPRWKGKKAATGKKPVEKVASSQNSYDVLNFDSMAKSMVMNQPTPTTKGKRKGADDDLEFGWDGGDGKVEAGEWRQGLCGCTEHGCLFLLSLTCNPCDNYANLFEKYELPGGGKMGYCCGVCACCLNGATCCVVPASLPSMFIRWKVTEAENIEVGYLDMLLSCLCPMLNYFQIMGHAKSVGKLKEAPCVPCVPCCGGGDDDDSSD